MTDSSAALQDWDCTPTSLRAALDELAEMPVDVTASRMIAMAVGVLIERFKITAEEAFDLMVAVGQQKAVGVSDLASQLAVGEDPECLWSEPAVGAASAG